MALFKVNRGNSSSLPVTMTDGWAYFCTDTAEFYIDYADADGVLHRAQLNAKDAETLTGASLSAILQSSDVEIPTSNAVLNYLNDNVIIVEGGATTSMSAALGDGPYTIEFTDEEYAGVSASDINYANGQTQMAATTVQTAIDELFTYASDGKSKIAAAITGKGINAADSDTFAEMADKIGQIDGGESETTIYAMLYDDGNLVFQTDDTVDSTKTLTESYTISNQAITTSDSEIPWNDILIRRNINKVSFDDNIELASLSYMFANFYNATNIDTTNLSTAKVRSMAKAYHNCFNMVGSPTCGANVTSMVDAYNSCRNITGSAVCGDKVTSMAGAYWSCSNITGSPVCGEKVVDMENTFRSCSNLTGNPVCGNKVTRLINTYYYCTNLTGSPVCGPNVKNMAYAYYNCTNLTGNPVCGENVVNMYSTYQHCANLSGQPVCGNNVESFAHAYFNCLSLSGVPVCGDKVTSLMNTYAYCTNLTGSPVCGPNVISIAGAYKNCFKLTGSPVCGSNVTEMTDAYCNCYNLSGAPVCGENVTRMNNAYYNCYNLRGNPACGNSVNTMLNAYYNCTNLTGAPACGASVTNMRNAYYGCTNLYGNAYFYSSEVKNVANCFNGRDNSRRLNIYVPAGTNTNTTVHYINASSLVGTSIAWTSSGSYRYNAQHNIYIYPVDDVAAARAANGE